MAHKDNLLLQRNTGIPLGRMPLQLLMLPSLRELNDYLFLEVFKDTQWL